MNARTDTKVRLQTLEVTEMPSSQEREVDFYTETKIKNA